MNPPDTMPPGTGMPPTGSGMPPNTMNPTDTMPPGTGMPPNTMNPPDTIPPGTGMPPNTMNPPNTMLPGTGPPPTGTGMPPGTPPPLKNLNNEENSLSRQNTDRSDRTFKKRNLERQYKRQEIRFVPPDTFFIFNNVTMKNFVFQSNSGVSYGSTFNKVSIFPNATTYPIHIEAQGISFLMHEI